MSAHFSKFMLNTYCGSPYFEAHIPADYPLSLVLQKCRAFRRLPPHFRELSALAKRWEQRAHPDSGFSGINQWYDDDGYELNPDTAERLTDEEIDVGWDALGLDYDDFEVEDIPVPDGGFADPDTWEEPAPEPEEPEEGPTREQLLSDIASHGRERTADEYGIPVDQLPPSPDRPADRPEPDTSGGENARH